MLTSKRTRGLEGGRGRQDRERQEALLGSAGVAVGEPDGVASGFTGKGLGTAWSGETGTGIGPFWSGRGVQIGMGIFAWSGETGTGIGPFWSGRGVQIGIGGLALSGDTGTGTGGAGVAAGVADGVAAASFGDFSPWAFATWSGRTAATAAARTNLAAARESKGKGRSPLS
jgi:hypothetical protein